MRAGVDSIQISAYVAARAFIYDFSTHGVSNVRQPVASGRESASDAVNPFTEKYLYPVDAPIQHKDV
jgi:hypothetical protein